MIIIVVKKIRTAVSNYCNLLPFPLNITDLFTYETEKIKHIYLYTWISFLTYFATKNLFKLLEISFYEYLTHIYNFEFNSHKIEPTVYKYKRSHIPIVKQRIPFTRTKVKLLTLTLHKVLLNSKFEKKNVISMAIRWYC